MPDGCKINISAQISGARVIKYVYKFMFPNSLHVHDFEYQKVSAYNLKETKDLEKERKKKIPYGMLIA